MNHGDLEGFATAIRQIVYRPEFAAELGRNARRYAEEHLSWSILIDDWLEQMGTQTHPARTAIAS